MIVMATTLVIIVEEGDVENPRGAARAFIIDDTDRDAGLVVVIGEEISRILMVQREFAFPVHAQIQNTSDSIAPIHHHFVILHGGVGERAFQGDAVVLMMYP